MSAKPIFIGGTSSNAGKSWMATAVCAWLHRQGVRVAPFKAQNMSNHSYPCRGGGEIGRAQVAQAEACGLEPEPAMNPILLKPNGNGTSQVVVHGRVWKTLPAREYYAQVEYLLGEVVSAYEELARRFDVIVIEGAGSVSEINLRAHDLVNLGLATRLHAPWVLVADIERGGVFASVVGTMAVLTPEERALFKGFLVNRFRGDMSLFDEGRTMLERLSGAPCLGVFPHAERITVHAEDSLAIERTPTTAAPAGASVAIVQFPRLSNGTDVRLLTWADWITSPVDRHYDFVILPGSKDTLSDLAWLRDRGLEPWIRAQHQRGATVLGICGGFQMMGRTISDPHGVESGAGSATGLGLVAADTVLLKEKTTRVRRVTVGGISCEGYEIHMGETTLTTSYPPFAQLEDGSDEGVVGPGVIGTYLHGALEDAAVCSAVFRTHVPAPSGAHRSYDALADWFARHADRPADWLPSA